MAKVAKLGLGGRWMLLFRKGDIVLIGEGACGRDALREAERGSEAVFYLLEGVSLPRTVSTVATLRADMPSQIGKQLSAHPETRVFLAGEFPRPRIENLQLLGEDPLLFTILLGSAGIDTAPLGKSGIRALEDGCRNADLVPTSLDDVLAVGTIRYGDLAGPPLREAKRQELEDHLGALLSSGGNGIAFVSGSVLIEPSRPRPIKRSINETHFETGGDTSMLWAPFRTCLFDVSYIDELIVNACAERHIRAIVLAGSEVIPAETETLRSACERRNVSLYRSRIGD